MFRFAALLLLMLPLGGAQDQHTLLRHLTGKTEASSDDRRLKSNNNNQNSNNNVRDANGLCIRGQKCTSATGVIERYPCTPRSQVVGLTDLASCEASCGTGSCCRIYNYAFCDGQEYVYNRCVCEEGNTIPREEWGLDPLPTTTTSTTTTTNSTEDRDGPTLPLVLGTCGNPLWVNKGFGFKPTDSEVLADLAAFGLEPGSCMEASHCNSARGNCCNVDYCVCFDTGSDRSRCLGG